MGRTLWPNGSTTIPRVTSEFNPSRKNPVTGVVQPHNGIDLVGWTDNVAPVSGVVIFAGYNGGAGNEVRIQGDDGNFYRILHHAVLYVRTGQRVIQGQAVGRMGTTGQSTGVHTHFETHPGRLWNYQNPRTFMANANAGTAGGGGTPLPSTEEDEMPHFGSGNRIYWPNGFFNTYDQGVFNALKYYFENDTELQGTEGTVVREVWAANNWMLNTSVTATAAASAKATVEALKASGIPVAVELDDDDIAALSADVAKSVLAGIPKPAESFEVTVKPTAS